MINLKTPKWLKKHAFNYSDINKISFEDIKRIKRGLSQYHSDFPEVSIVIPAYNEEKEILRTLSSLAEIETTYRVELIVVNNNSSDGTGKLLEMLGVRTIFEPRQGISNARQTGLNAARGRFILSADADSIYPKSWVDSMVEPLKNTSVACVYGSYSFLEQGTATRRKLALYEILVKHFLRLRTSRKPYLNVMGFNSAYRRDDALAIGGYSRERQLWEDGRLAMDLMVFGSVLPIYSERAKVWTMPRRLLMDGSLGRALIKRIKKEIRNLHEFIF